MNDLYIGVDNSLNVYELFRITEKIDNLLILCALGGTMGAAFAHNNLTGEKKMTHDPTPKEIIMKRYSLHKTPNNPMINSFNFHLRYKGSGEKVMHVQNTPAIKVYDAFVPIFCERYGEITPNLKGIPKGEEFISLGPVDFQTSTLFYAVFVGPKGREFSNTNPEWKYEYIQRDLFDVHILWRSIKPLKVGHGFLGFQTTGNWSKNEVDDEMIEALQKPLDNTGIAKAIMQAGTMLFKL